MGEMPVPSERELQAQVKRLRPHFLGNSAAGASAADLAAAAAIGQETAGGNNSLPPSLRLLWGAAAEWHLLAAGHCDVFGFNLFAPRTLRETTVQIFGDEDNRADWARAHGEGGGATCAAAGWAAIASFSEYDYLYCCLDRGSPSFGDVRHMVNNCFEEQPCCHVDELPGHLLGFVEEMAAIKAAAGRGEPTEVHPAGATSAGLTRGLQCLRAGILEYGEEEDE